MWKVVKGDPDAFLGRAFLYTHNLRGEEGDSNNPRYVCMIAGSSFFEHLVVARSEGLPADVKEVVRAHYGDGLFQAQVSVVTQDSDRDVNEPYAVFVPFESDGRMEPDDINGDVLHLMDVPSHNYAVPLLKSAAALYLTISDIQQRMGDARVLSYNRLTDEQFLTHFMRITGDLKTKDDGESATNELAELSRGSPFEARTRRVIGAYRSHHPGIREILDAYILEVMSIHEQDYEGAQAHRDVLDGLLGE